MAQPNFDKDGNLSNLDELTVQEVASAYSEKNKSLFGRLNAEETARKQAEADKLKLAEENETLKKKPQVEEKPSTPAISEEQSDLIAKAAYQLSDEELQEAKVIAKGKGITLAEALKDKTFLIVQANLKEEKRKEDAKLGASHGSGQGSSEESEFKPGMSAAEHRAAFDKKRGKAA